MTTRLKQVHIQVSIYELHSNHKSKTYDTQKQRERNTSIQLMKSITPQGKKQKEEHRKTTKPTRKHVIKWK